jgi:hypothetical protein
LSGVAETSSISSAGGGLGPSGWIVAAQCLKDVIRLTPAKRQRFSSKSLEIMDRGRPDTR